MANKLYKKIIKDRVDAFLKESKSIDLLTHNGLRGEIRESSIGKLISDLLPIDWGIGSGKIIDSNDIQSSQTDLIVYYKKVLPPIFFNTNVGIFPIECCGFAFEIKTKSNATEIQNTVENFKKLKDMQIMMPFSDIESIYCVRPIRVYLALDTDLNKESEFERYKKYDPEYNEDPIIELICVIGKGIWFASKAPPWSDNKIKWTFYPSQGNNEELLLLLGAVINQILSLLTLGYINMDKYMWDENELWNLEFKGLKSENQTNT